VFSKGQSGFCPRVSLSIPTTGNTDPLHSLFLRLPADTRASAAGLPWFCHRDLVSATAAGLCGVSARPSRGERFTPRSLRTGGITAAYAVGVPLERIMRLSNHATAADVMRHYLGPLVPPTPAARVFFQRFVPSLCSLPLPAVPVSPSVGNPRAAEPTTSTELRSAMASFTRCQPLLALPPFSCFGRLLGCPIGSQRLLLVPLCPCSPHNAHCV
jgi:hypothetical protein